MDGCGAPPDRAPTATTLAGLMTSASAAGMPASTAAADLLATAAGRPRCLVDRRDTTLVGHHATCVHVTGLTSGGPFDICVTSDGVLASFEAQWTATGSPHPHPLP